MKHLSFTIRVLGSTMFNFTELMETNKLNSLLDKKRTWTNRPYCSTFINI